MPLVLLLLSPPPLLPLPLPPLPPLLLPLPLPSDYPRITGLPHPAPRLTMPTPYAKAAAKAGAAVLCHHARSRRQRRLQARRPSTVPPPPLLWLSLQCRLRSPRFPPLWLLRQQRPWDGPLTPAPPSIAFLLSCSATPQPGWTPRLILLGRWSSVRSAPQHPLRAILTFLLLEP